MTKHVLVVAVDGWSAHSIGPYGNTMVETPALNRLAAQGLLFDNAFIDSPDLASIYQSLWTGRHPSALEATSPEAPEREWGSWVEQVNDAGYRTLLLTDCSSVQQHPAADAFREHEVVPATESGHSADSLDQTSLARYFERVIEVFERAAREDDGSQSSDAGLLMWCHCRGMTGPWDAPYSLRMEHVDEEDPDPPRFVEPPAENCASPLDPDRRFGLQVAYAAQIEVLDACLGALLESLGSLASSTTLVLMGVRGYPLGEHGGVGLREPRLYGELLSVPLVVRFPRGHRAGADAPVRSPALIQPHQIGQAVAVSLLGSEVDAIWPNATELGIRTEGRGVPDFEREAEAADQRYQASWLRIEDDDEEVSTAPSAADGDLGDSVHETGPEARPEVGPEARPGAVGAEASFAVPPVAVAFARNEQAIRTPSWFARFADGRAELYAKPDDRFEVNEVAARGVEELEQLSEVLRAFQASAAQGVLSPAPALPGLLVRAHD